LDPYSSASRLVPDDDSGGRRAPLTLFQGEGECETPFESLSLFMDEDQPVSELPS